MTLITDRTEADVRAGNEKGAYGYTDLNRVEKAVAEIAAAAGLDLITKTDWAAPGEFSTDAWPTQSQMERYLGNVKKIRDAFSLSVMLPTSMDQLTWRYANNIELVLQQAYKKLGR